MTPPNGKSHIAVRPLQADDAPRLQATCWPSLDALRARERVALTLSFERQGRAWPHVGLYDDQTVGFAQLAVWNGCVEVADVVVGARWRSRGVGTALVRRLVALAAELGFPRVEIGVAESNRRALALYRRLGFTCRERRVVLDLGNGSEPVIYLSRPSW